MRVPMPMRPLPPRDLPAISIDRGALQIAAVGDGDGHVLHRHQVFQANLAGVFDDLGAALVAVILLDFLQFFDDDFAHQLSPSPAFPGTRAMRRWISASSSAIFCCSMPVRRCNCSSMMACACRSVNWKAAIKRFAGFARRARRPDQPDHFVEIVQRLLEAEQDMLALAGFAQFVIGAAPDHFHAMLDEVLDAIDQAQLARLAVDDRQHDDAEADLQLRVLVEIVQHHFGLLAALQLEDDAHAVAVALVADFGNAFDLLLVDQRGGVFDQPRTYSPGRESR